MVCEEDNQYLLTCKGDSIINATIMLFIVNYEINVVSKSQKECNNVMTNSRINSFTVST